MLTKNEKRAVIYLADAAGEKIMAIYAQDFDIDYYETPINPVVAAATGLDELDLCVELILQHSRFKVSFSI